MIIKPILPSENEIFFENPDTNGITSENTQFALKVVLPSNSHFFDNGAFYFNNSTYYTHIQKNNFGELSCILSSVSESKWDSFVPYPLGKRGQIFINTPSAWIDALDFPEMKIIIENWKDYKKSKNIAWGERLNKLSEYGFSDTENYNFRTTMTLSEIDCIIEVLEKLRLIRLSKKEIRQAFRYPSIKHLENVLGFHVSSYKATIIAIRHYIKEMNYTISY